MMHAAVNNRKRIVSLFTSRCQSIKNYGNYENNVSNRFVVLLDEAFDLVAATDRLQHLTSLFSTSPEETESQLPLPDEVNLMMAT